MSALSDDLANIVQTNLPPRCNVNKLLMTLEPDDAFALKTAIDNVALSPRQISLWLSKHGHHISQDSIYRHRTKCQHNRGL